MEYNFSIERLYTIWEREYVYIEADSLGMATDILMKQFQDGSVDAERTEIIYESMREVSSEEARGRPTIEIFNENGDKIFDNGSISIYAEDDQC